jgi:hypothetical protein
VVKITILLVKITTETALIIRKLAVPLQSEIINHFKGPWKERTGKKYKDMNITNYQRYIDNARKN